MILEEIRLSMLSLIKKHYGNPEGFAVLPPVLPLERSLAQEWHQSLDDYGLVNLSWWIANSAEKGFPDEEGEIASFLVKPYRIVEVLSLSPMGGCPKISAYYYLIELYLMGLDRESGVVAIKKSDVRELINIPPYDPYLTEALPKYARQEIGEYLVFGEKRINLFIEGFGERHSQRVDL